MNPHPHAVKSVWLSVALALGPAVLAADAPAPPKAAPNSASKNGVSSPPPPPAVQTNAQIRRQADEIDRLVLAGLKAKGQSLNAPISEEVFLRRVCLDTIGRLPTVEEAEAYMADTRPDKRTRIIGWLLAAPGHGSHQFNWLADLLRIRDNLNNQGAGFVYENWLKAELDANRPWDALVRDMLTADGKLCDQGATGFLLRDADMPLDGASYMMSTLLGANLACAQCHDHPTADWSQKDFYQMAAFFGATSLRDDKSAKQAQILGKSGAVDAIPQPVARRIVSNNILRVQDGHRQKLVLPANYKYPDGKPGAAVTPAFVAWTLDDAKGPAYRLGDPAKADPPRLRATFAAWLTHPDNPRFAANIANREWKRFFGVAVQEPVGDIDDLSLGANPELLAGLTKLMREVNFDLRRFETVILNTRAYQSAATPSARLEQNAYLFNGPLVRRMSAAQAWDSIIVMGAGKEVDLICEVRGEAQKAANVPGNDFTKESMLAAAKRLEATGLMPRDFLGKKADALSKRAMGEMNAKQAASVMAQYVGGRPKFGRAGVMVRASEMQQPAPETHFLRMFGQSDRQVACTEAYEGSIPQTLSLMNGPVSDIVAGRQSVVLEAAKSCKTQEAQVERLYLAFFTRKPSAGETARAVSALKNGLLLSDLAWVLLNAHEFLFVR